MRIEGIVWLKDILDKIEAKHSVQQSEVEEIFKNVPKIQFCEKGKIKEENLYVARGQTDSGRYLAVFFIFKKTREALIVSARDMDKSERRNYAKK